MVCASKPALTALPAAPAVDPTDAIVAKIVKGTPLEGISTTPDLTPDEDLAQVQQSQNDINTLANAMNGAWNNAMATPILAAAANGTGPIPEVDEDGNITHLQITGGLGSTETGTISTTSGDTQTANASTENTKTTDQLIAMQKLIDANSPPDLQITGGLQVPGAGQPDATALQQSIANQDAAIVGSATIPTGTTVSAPIGGVWGKIYAGLQDPKILAAIPTAIVALGVLYKVGIAFKNWLRNRDMKTESLFWGNKADMIKEVEAYGNAITIYQKLMGDLAKANRNRVQAGQGNNRDLINYKLSDFKELDSSLDEKLNLFKYHSDLAKDALKDETAPTKNAHYNNRMPLVRIEQATKAYEHIVEAKLLFNTTMLDVTKKEKEIEREFLDANNNAIKIELVKKKQLSLAEYKAALTLHGADIAEWEYFAKSEYYRARRYIQEQAFWRAALGMYTPQFMKLLHQKSAEMHKLRVNKKTSESLIRFKDIEQIRSDATAADGKITENEGHIASELKVKEYVKNKSIGLIEKIKNFVIGKKNKDIISKESTIKGEVWVPLVTKEKVSKTSAKQHAEEFKKRQRTGQIKTVKH